MKLTIELVPQSAWYKNVRSNISASVWDKIRKKCYKEANNICEICGDSGKNQGVRHNVECHEIWFYDDINHIQILTGLIALCPRCHKTKHVGLSRIKNEEHLVINQLVKVNNISEKEAYEYIKESFDIWCMRNEHKWKLDISYIDTYITNNNPQNLFED